MKKFLKTLAIILATSLIISCGCPNLINDYNDESSQIIEKEISNKEDNSQNTETTEIVEITETIETDDKSSEEINEDDVNNDIIYNTVFDVEYEIHTDDNETLNINTEFLELIKSNNPNATSMQIRFSIPNRNGGKIQVNIISNKIETSHFSGDFEIISNSIENEKMIIVVKTF